MNLIELKRLMREKPIFGNRMSQILGIGRKLVHSPLSETGSSNAKVPAASVPAKKGKDQVNLVSSEVIEGWHAPAIDFDFPCYAVPSRTPGHSHIYLNKITKWEDYVNVLKALAAAGLVEQGYCDASIARGASFVRLPSTVDVSDVFKNELG